MVGIVSRWDVPKAIMIRFSLCQQPVSLHKIIVKASAVAKISTWIFGKIFGVIVTIKVDDLKHSNIF